MFILSHLVAGIIVGIILARAFRDRRAIPAAAFGALLPDIIDKPLGHVFLAMGYGRIYSHTLLFLLCAVLVGTIVYWRYRSVLALAAAAGIASHQVLDAMWREPTNWLYPFLGPFSYSGEGRSIVDLIMSELAEPTEWILFAAVILFGLAYLYGGRYEAIRARFAPLLDRAFLVLGLLLLAAGLWVAGSVFLHQPCMLTAMRSPEDHLICGLVIALAGVAAFSCRKPQ
jgi:membrane-bound metal-dependent hydrolase YbcI (DUF457 family)